MLVFPNCKINLGLRITGKRTDGYHNIETVFFPVKLYDALEIIHAAGDPQSLEIELTLSGIQIDGDEKDNLCVRAWYLLKKDFPQLPAIKIHLHKAIPVGAGLGGGSADAAFTLAALNEKYALKLQEHQLSSYASQLGSDCAFFINNRPSLATGRGEILQTINTALNGYRLILVNPGIRINTKWAFSQLNIDDQPAPETSSTGLADIISQPVSSWKDRLINAFEIPVFEKYSEIRAIKAGLYNKGAIFSSMSGSGSTVFGIFDKNHHPVFKFPESYTLANILL